MTLKKEKSKLADTLSQLSLYKVKPEELKDLIDPRKYPHAVNLKAFIFTMEEIEVVSTEKVKLTEGTFIRVNGNIDIPVVRDTVSKAEPTLENRYFDNKEECENLTLSLNKEELARWENVTEQVKSWGKMLKQIVEEKIVPVKFAEEV